MPSFERWTVRDRDGNEVYITQERWGHIIEPSNHPEMETYEDELRLTVRQGSRHQDPLDPQKYRYTKAFDHLVGDNTHIVAVVLFRFKDGGSERPHANNFIVTAYQKEVR